MQIKDLMSHPAVTCPTTATLDHAARLMWEFDCGVVPVVDEKGHLTGVLTDRDICMAAYTQGKVLSDISVTTAMAKNVIALRGDETLESAEHLMADNQIRRLPVLDRDDHVIGVVSINDMARLAEASRRIGIDREFVTTIAAVGQPRTNAQVRHDLAQLTLTEH